MNRVLLTVILVVTMAGAARASDVAAAVAALPDEKAECRYLNRLADEYFEAVATFTKAQSDAVTAMDTGGMFAPKPEVYKAKTQEAAAARKAAGARLEDIEQAERIMFAKREEPPKCIAEVKARFEAARAK